MSKTTSARADLIQAIEQLLDMEEGTPSQERAWEIVEQRIDFFENTVDYASFEAGKIAGVEEIRMERQ